jgi:hypothetical protein
MRTRYGRTLLLLLAATMFAAPQTARAQEGESLQLGARYRVRLPKLPDVDGPQFPKGRLLAGALVERRGDSLVLRPHPTTGSVTVPLSSVERLEKSRGISRIISAVEGAVGAAAVGALFGFVDYQLDVRGSGYDTRWQAIGASAGNAALGGFAVGLLFPAERWKRVEKPAVR